MLFFAWQDLTTINQQLYFVKILERLLFYAKNGNENATTDDVIEKTE